jgi:hypothetical protein
MVPHASVLGPRAHPAAPLDQEEPLDMGMRVVAQPHAFGLGDEYLALHRLGEIRWRTKSRQIPPGITVAVRHEKNLHDLVCPPIFGRMIATILFIKKLGFCQEYEIINRPLSRFFIFGIIYLMNIYLDESYNLQKSKGKMFISINGFSVLNAERLRKRWKHIRQPYTKHKRRIHATDPFFEGLRSKSIPLLKANDIMIISVFQIVQEIPYDYFDNNKMNFEVVYAELLKQLLKELSLNEYKQTKIIIDSRKHKGGIAGATNFQQEINNFLKNKFPGTVCSFLPTPSYLDVLVELADFVSNTFYKNYQK